MSEMSQRMASAIARETYGGGVPGVSLDHEEWALCCNIARVALSAMRVPTTHMLFEGVVAQDGSAEVQGIYTAMIDAALTETP